MNTKNRLLAASQQLFLDKGFYDTKVEEICQLAETAKGSFFYYFDKKENVLEILLRQQVKSMAEKLILMLNTIPSAAKQFSMMMSLLLNNITVGPEALSYFKEDTSPLWFETLSLQIRDEHILPIIEGIIELGKEQNEFDKDITSKSVEIIHLGITHYTHKYYNRWGEATFFKESISSIETVINDALKPKTRIQIDKKFSLNNSFNTIS